MHLSLFLNYLKCSLQWTRDRNRINVLLYALNDSDDFGSLGKLHGHVWTDEQITSIFRVRTTGDKVHNYINLVLFQIQEEDVAAFNHEPSKYSLAPSNMGRTLRQSLDGSAWDDEHLALLYDALHETPG